MFLQAVIHLITGDAFEQGAKVSVFQFLTSVSLLYSMKCFKCHHDTLHNTNLKKNIRPVY